MIPVFVLLSFTVFRITRFLIEDNLIIEPRIWLLNRIAGTPEKMAKMWRAKLHYLLRCPFCLSLWVTAGAIAILCQYVRVPLPFLMSGAVWGGSMAVWRFVEQN